MQALRSLGCQSPYWTFEDSVGAYNSPVANTAEMPIFFLKGSCNCHIG